MNRRTSFAPVIRDCGRGTHGDPGVISATLALMLTLGGFIFYNTNVLNAYSSASDRTARRAEYERRFGRYRDAPKPRVTRLEVKVELYPRRRAADNGLDQGKKSSRAHLVQLGSRNSFDGLARRVRAGAPRGTN